MALLGSLIILCFFMLLGGAAWTVFMSVFNIIVQELAPDWVRSRVLAFYLFVFQGSVAGGSTALGIIGCDQPYFRNRILMMGPFSSRLSM